MEKAKGIDVSHWQGRIDFEKVKSQGYSFVMINAGYGKYISQKDILIAFSSAVRV